MGNYPHLSEEAFLLVKDLSSCHGEKHIAQLLGFPRRVVSLIIAGKLFPGDEILCNKSYMTRVPTTGSTRIRSATAVMNQRLNGVKAQAVDGSPPHNMYLSIANWQNRTILAEELGLYVPPEDRPAGECF